MQNICNKKILVVPPFFTLGGLMKFGFILLVVLMGGGAARAQSQGANLNSPQISADALFLYRQSNFHREDLSTTRNGFDLQEVELAFFSDVDVENRLSLLLSIHPEYSLSAAGTEVEQKWKVEPEELFVENSSIPLTAMKVGILKAAVGKTNPLHTHAYPFVEAPLVYQNLLGDEGLKDAGISAAILLPTSFFSEVTTQYLRGAGENTEFSSPTPGDGVGVAHWKNLFDLSEALTLEIGGSLAQGGNNLRGTTRISGGDFTFKWRPIEGGKYKSWIFAGEYLNRQMDQPPVRAKEIGDGWAVWGQYQFAQRWAALARSEIFRGENGDLSVNSNALTNDKTYKQSVAVVFNPSEFTFYRLEFDSLHGPAQPNGDTDERKILLQANFVIGSHPAHNY